MNPHTTDKTTQRLERLLATPALQAALAQHEAELDQAAGEKRRAALDALTAAKGAAWEARRAVEEQQLILERIERDRAIAGHALGEANARLVAVEQQVSQAVRALRSLGQAELVQAANLMRAEIARLEHDVAVLPDAKVRTGEVAGFGSLTQLVAKPHPRAAAVPELKARLARLHAALTELEGLEAAPLSPGELRAQADKILEREGIKRPDVEGEALALLERLNRNRVPA